MTWKKMTAADKTKNYPRGFTVMGGVGSEMEAIRCIAGFHFVIESYNKS